MPFYFNIVVYTSTADAHDVSQKNMGKAHKRFSNIFMFDPDLSNDPVPDPTIQSNQN